MNTYMFASLTWISNEFRARCTNLHVLARRAWKWFLGEPSLPGKADALVAGGSGGEMAASMLEYVERAHEAWLIGEKDPQSQLYGTPGIHQFLYGDRDGDFTHWDIVPAIGNSPYRKNSRINPNLILNASPFINEGWIKTEGGGSDPAIVDGEIHFSHIMQYIERHDVELEEGERYAVSVSYEVPGETPNPPKGLSILLGYDRNAPGIEDEWYYSKEVGEHSKTIVMEAGPLNYITIAPSLLSKVSQELDPPVIIRSLTVRKWEGDSLFLPEDPTDVVQDIVDEAEELHNYYKGMEDPETYYTTFIEKGREEYDNTSDFSDDALDDLMSEFSRRSLPEYMQSVARFTAGMSDINAVQTSSFINGMLLMELDFLREMNTTRGRIMLQRNQMRVQSASQAAQAMLQALTQIAQTRQNAFRTYMTAKTQGVVAQTEYTDAKAEIAYKDAIWDIQILNQGANLMSAPQGVAHVAPSRSKTANALTTALSGAAMVGGLATQGGWDLGLGLAATGLAGLGGFVSEMDPWRR